MAKGFTDSKGRFRPIVSLHDSKGKKIPKNAFKGIGVPLKRIPPQKGLEDLNLFHGQTKGFDVKKKKKVNIQNEKLLITKNGLLLIKGDSPSSEVTVSVIVGSGKSIG